MSFLQFGSELSRLLLWRFNQRQQSVSTWRTNLPDGQVLANSGESLMGQLLPKGFVWKGSWIVVSFHTDFVFF